MNAYKFYRLTITETYRNGGTTAQTFANLSEFSLYNADGDDVAEASGCKYSASSSHSTGPVSGAFDNKTSTFWHSDWNNDVKKEHWIQVELPEAAIVSSLGLNTRSNTGGYDDVPGSFYLSASNDGKTWAIVLEQQKLSTGWSPGVERFFTLPEQNLCFYGNVLLPEIPEELRSKWKYLWIRKSISDGNYDLAVSDTIQYFSSSDKKMWMDSGSQEWWLTPINNPTGWTWKASYTGKDSWKADSNYAVIWANYDIPEGSASATNVYLYGIEPVPENTGDQIMKHLQSTGLQYIDTGVFASPEYSVEVSFKVTRATTNWDTIFGTRTNTGSRFTARFSNSTNGLLGLQYSNRGAGAATLIDTEYTKSMFSDELRVIRAEKNQWYIDNVLVYTFDASADAIQYPSRLFLFANSNSNEPEDYAYIRIAYCKIWNNGVLVRDFVPLWRNGVACMWDKIEEKVYVSEGTAPFFAGSIVGPNVEIKYLTSGEAEIQLPSPESIGNLLDSFVEWDANVPEGTSCKVYFKKDSGDYLECMNQGKLPGVTIGDDLTESRLYIKILLSTEDVFSTPHFYGLKLLLKDGSNPSILILTFASGNTNSIQNAVGDIRCSYGGGTLRGEGGAVAPFDRYFTPVDLDPKNNPHDEEHLEVSSIEAAGNLIQVQYLYGYVEEHLEISNIVAAGTLTHIDDL